ncbi:MAG TPA: electron transfer flavoprotein subunit beta/FixA family protein [Saprospiraceae bacterium]|nr:electron transfer flavoprotein subunit beta/FixA family protein [Saprospiraceae bacterium]MCB9328162.1 electron transfer flavoprotein subunit beta/FixA family protein [Lewinellaceae bacterium]HPK10102.1 electron transfer flavoprotein subunit beta/FixA family protein [Saprospiraceae bacterium]HPQ22279.1 electron transfer flavoprotein subunit beta/FixA family protein [Saprospiraceae bacterium]HRX30164.1 electron transfer flavoprotein subunit beta/FixA family protein [Saprospiraceae bacterium]
MNILVCISKTPDTTSKISFVDDNMKFNEQGVNFIMNPYDEWYALVRAIELVEQNGGKVTVISVGGSDYDIIIRKALAIGADNAVRIDMQAEDASQVALEIANYARSRDFEVIFTGKETIDFNGSEVGAMIAALLDMPFVSYASHLEYADGKFVIDRDIEGGIEKVQVNEKFVLSAAKGLAQQRIPNMKGIMMSKSKPLEVMTPLSGNHPRVKVDGFETPPAKSGVKLINPENMDELVRLLHEEAKVI